MEMLIILAVLVAAAIAIQIFASRNGKGSTRTSTSGSAPELDAAIAENIRAFRSEPMIFNIHEDEDDGPATERQLSYLESRGVLFREPPSFTAASVAIGTMKLTEDALLEEFGTMPPQSSRAPFIWAVSQDENVMEQANLATQRFKEYGGGEVVLKRALPFARTAVRRAISSD